jgi:hypothetical protein
MSVDWTWIQIIWRVIQVLIFVADGEVVCGACVQHGIQKVIAGGGCCVPPGW